MKSGLWHHVVWQMVTTISEVFAASIFIVYWTHTTCHHIWKYCNFSAHQWTLQIFVVNVSSCSHTEFPALCLSCKVNSVTSSWSWDKTLPETSKAADHNGIYGHQVTKTSLWTACYMFSFNKIELDIYFILLSVLSRISFYFQLEYVSILCPEWGCFSCQYHNI